MDYDYNDNDLYWVEKTSLEETKNNIEWRNCAFEFEQKNSYGIENWNDLIHIHEKEVNKIAKYNLLYGIINPPKRAKNINIHYSPILHGFMNPIKGRAKFNSFQNLL